MTPKNGDPRIIHSLAWFSVILTLGAAPARATIVPHLDLEALAQNADLIVVGRARSQEKLERTTLGPAEGNLPAWVTIVRLDVEKVIKGKLEAASVSFRMVQPIEGVGAEAPRYKSVSVGQFGVFFLHISVTGYEVLDPYHPFVPAPPGAPVQQGNYLDAVAAELAHVFDSHDASVQSRWVRWDAVRALESLQTSKATAALRAASKDPDTLVRIWAISALLSRNDVSMLEQVEKLGALPPDPHVTNLTSQLGFAIGRISDGRAVPSLARLLKSGDLNIRRGAAAALRNTQDGAAIKPLTQALYDSDREVLYQAVIGLAEITGTIGEWAPAYDTFQKDEKRYSDHWRDWAKSRK